MNEIQNIFTKIKTINERDQLFIDLFNCKAEILCKSRTQEVFKLKPTKLNEQNIECAFDKKNMNQSQTVIVMFSLAGDKYFCQSFLHVKNNKVSLDTVVDVYKMQRRSHYRVFLPPGYMAEFRAKTINGIENTFKTEISDISAGGLRLKSTAKFVMLKKGDLLEGTIHLKNRSQIEIKCQIRYTRKQRDGRKEFTYVGVQITPLTAQLEHKMMAIVMEIYRELFTRGRD